MSEASALAEEAAALGIEIKDGWSEKYIKRLITMKQNGTEPTGEDDAEDAEPPKTVLMRLHRNYRPLGYYEVVNAREAPFAGVGYPDKIWAGSDVLLPVDEARDIMQKGIATRGIDF